MQVVYILGDDMGDLARIDQSGNRHVALIRLGGHDGLVDLEFASPGLSAHFRGFYKVIKIDRGHLCPQASGRTKIGDTRFCAYPRAGEDNYARSMLNL